METILAVAILGLLLVGCGIGACGAKYVIQRRQAGVNGLLVGEAKPTELVPFANRNDDASL